MPKRRYHWSESTLIGKHPITGEEVKLPQWYLFDQYGQYYAYIQVAMDGRMDIFVGKQGHSRHVGAEDFEYEAKKMAKAIVAEWGL